MRRVEEILNARRNKVNSKSTVGNTLNSTGRVMYIETSRTITETVMFALISTSSRKEGIGAIIARTIPKTASGTLKSARFPNRDARVGAPTEAFFSRCLAGPPARWSGIEDDGTGAIWDVAAMCTGA